MKYILSVGFLAVVALVSCAPTRRLAPEEQLLSQVEIVMTDSIHDEYKSLNLENYISQRPNKRIFGVWPLSLDLYNLSNPKSTSWVNRLLRSWGTPPVVYSPEETSYSQQSITAALYNRGYLRAYTEVRLDTIGKQQVRVSYKPQIGELFRIGQKRVYIEDSILSRHIFPKDTLSVKKVFPSNQYRSLIEVGDLLAPDRLRLEQQRITHLLRNQGYWSFNEANIRFNLDTLESQNSWVDLHIDSVFTPYRIGKVRIYNNVSPQDSLVQRDSISGIEVISALGHPHLRPAILARRSWIRPKDLYAESLVSRTYSALADFGALRTSNLYFFPDTTAQYPILNCDILTTAERSKELLADVVGTHSGGNLGLNASVGLMHNNLFSGGEKLKLEYRIGYENLRYQSSNQFSQGGTVTLSFPSLLTPIRAWRQAPLRGATNLSLTYDYHRRPEFNRNLFSASWGYNWQTYTMPALRHRLQLAEVDYMHFGYLDEAFRSSMPIITRLLHYRDQFIVSASYQLNYSTRNDYRYATLPYAHSLRLYVQSAGNLLYGLSSLAHSSKDQYGAYSLMNINFAQFVKAEIDYTHLHQLDTKNNLVAHLGLNVVYPYANSKILPIDIRYFSGGANSLRGWNARGLGPGAMKPTTLNSIFDQVGDIKLDLNLEYRSRLVNGFEIALFADAGNIWTIREYENQPDGAFYWDKFYRQIALSTGMGLRWDFDYFLLRFDLGLKLYSPQEDQGQRWVITNQPAKDLLAFHIALGYPF